MSVADTLTLSLTTAPGQLCRCPFISKSAAIKEIIVRGLPRPKGSATISPAKSSGYSDWYDPDMTF